MTSPHGRPTSDELLESLREWLERDVMAVGDARVAFHARVAANIIDIVRREQQTAPEFNARFAHILASLNVESDAELSQQIHDGLFDDRLNELLRVLRPVIEDKVRVANPKYLA